MPKRIQNSITFSIVLLFLLPALFAQAPTPSKQKDPADLTGVWMIDRFQPALFPKGTAPPFTPWAAEQFKKADTKVNDPNLACLPHGIPRLMFVPLPMEIFQVQDKVMMYQEAGNQLRQIHMNRDHLKDLDPTYNGDSIGKWDGSTLVVDTVGFNAITWLDHVGLPHTEALHVVERIRRIDHNTLVDDFTIEDPKAYTKNWTASQTYTLKPGWEIAEYVC
ncbi:MAG TPA: hypothetical protein VHS29_09280, partial [Candidatus Acidoferrales bacterium]|nr:hypothetical protein [Candidatus Acidoferrales bacterium]